LLVFIPIVLFMVLFSAIWLLVCAVMEREDPLLDRVGEYLETSKGSGRPAPFRSRVLVPLADGISGLVLRFYPPATVARLDKICDLAGRPMGIGGRGLILLKLFLAALLGTTGFLPPPVFRLPVGVIGMAIGYTFPGLWITLRIRSRLDRTRKDLADAMDLMVVCAEAGLGLDAAMQRVAARFPGPLGSAFGKCLSEIGVGGSREQALQNIAIRLPLDEIRAFASSLIQAERLGTGISQVLRIQAGTLRKQRRLRAEEHARKAPVKILFPLVMFIFPSLFVVMLGPAMIQIMETFK
jgi:tight adherence protein C